MLLASLLLAVVLGGLARPQRSDLPPAPPSPSPPSTSAWSGQHGLLSPAAHAKLMELLASVVGAWSGRAEPGEDLTSGPACRGAALDVAECGMLGWLEAQGTGTSPSMLPLAAAVFALAAHSDDSSASYCPPYDHGEDAGARLRSRQGLRAKKAWEAAAREVMVAVLAASGEGPGWLSGEAARLVEAVRKGASLGSRMVLADQAWELVIVRPCPPALPPEH